jgi:hypothetical protein
MKKKIGNAGLVGIFTLLLLSCLTKETGFLFIAVIIFYRYFFKPKRIWAFISGAVMTTAVYAAVRLCIGQVYFAQSSPTVVMVHTSLLGRLINMPAIFFFYIHTFVLPVQMVIDQQWIITRITPGSFYIPLFADSVFFLLIGLGGFWLHKKYPGAFLPYLFFFLWFLGGIGMVMQIFPLDMTVGDRWFYFPIVGLLGMTGVLLNSFGVSAGARKVITVLFVLVIFAFSYETVIRISVWHDEITLFEHDIPILKNRNSILSVGQLENDLAAYLLEANQVPKAQYYALDSLRYDPNPNRYNTLGMVYQVKKDYARSLYWYERAIAADNLEKAYENVTILLLTQNKDRQAEIIARKGLSFYPDDARLWVSLSYAAYFLHDLPKAQEASRRAVALSPDPDTQLLYQRLKDGQPLAL